VEDGRATAAPLQAMVAAQMIAIQERK